MSTKALIALSVTAALFVAHAVGLNFTQDDAFISFRYVKNYLNSQGLVFNAGERVEGYTSFFWIILLTLLSRVGLDMVLSSKIMGVMSGCITLFLLYAIASVFLRKRRRFESVTPFNGSVVGAQGDGARRSRLFYLLAPSFLLACNSAFAYWSISGLETAFFAMLVVLSVYLYFVRSRLMIVSCVLSILTRPEGVLVCAILIAHKLWIRRDSLRECVLYGTAIGVLLAPFLVFRLLYYGDILPNSFYAKTGLSLEYVRAGLAYFWLFAKHYGLWGFLYCLPILLYKNLGTRGKLIALVIYIYTGYILVIGGDVLKAHRFFLPVIPLVYLLFVFLLLRVHLVWKHKSSSWLISIGGVAAFALLTFVGPLSWMLNVRRQEIGLVHKMFGYGERLRQCLGTDYTLAVSTIGAISYSTDVRVIDMLGLTDSYIAKHPENVQGITSSWKERNFNISYLLSREPDVIMFSTGVRPSAPAEKALFLSSQFRDNYYLYYFPEGLLSRAVYRRKGAYVETNEIFPDARFVELYIDALHSAYRRSDWANCLEKLKETLNVCPEDFARVYELMGRCYYMMGDMEESKRFAQKAIQMDDYSILAHSLLHTICLQEGDTATARREKEKVLLYNPELVVGVKP